ncbi:glycosyl transferase [Rhodobacterales bacterium 52_120_T64]|nr:glycosyl transferase [Rhodobacterales bacterium 52_120_T64]
MPAPITVIIPTLNSAPHLQRCLGALGESIMDGLLAEVIFADGGSSDDTEQIAEEVGATFVSTPQGRGNQMAAAARVARGEWLLFLHADSVLDRGWQDAVIRHLANPEKAAYFKLRFDEESLPARTVATWANIRSRWLGLPYGDQGLLISKRLYKRIGGFAEIPLMEDVAMAKNLKGKLLTLPTFIETSAHKYRQDGWVKRSFTNFGVLMRYFSGADPRKLAARYYR